MRMQPKSQKKNSKFKILIILHHDSDDDVPIQNSVNNLVVTRHSSSNPEAMFHASERQKTTFSPTFNMPP